MTWKSRRSKGYDLARVKALGKRHHAGINCLQPQERIGPQQFGHPPVVVRGYLYDPQFVIGNCCTEFGGELWSAASFRICEQMTYLRDRQGWNHQPRPVFLEKPRASDMIVVSLVERGDERSCVAQDHADSAPKTHRDPGKSGTCRGSGQDRAGPATNQSAQTDAAATENHLLALRHRPTRCHS
jgi:hypothetical protein